MTTELYNNLQIVCIHTFFSVWNTFLYHKFLFEKKNLYTIRCKYIKTSKSTYKIKNTALTHFYSNRSRNLHKHKHKGTHNKENFSIFLSTIKSYFFKYLFTIKTNILYSKLKDMKYSKINCDKYKHWITLEVESHRNLIRANYKNCKAIH